MKSSLHFDNRSKYVSAIFDIILIILKLIVFAKMFRCESDGFDRLLGGRIS